MALYCIFPVLSEMQITLDIIHILFKGLPTLRGKGTDCLRIIAFKGFHYLDITGFLQFFDLMAQVPLRSTGDFHQVIEIGFFHFHQYGYNSEAHLGAEYGIQIIEHA